MNKWEFIKENYIDKGLKIFPIVPNGKKPMIDKWQEECSCDYFQVLYWYENCPDCNWGLPCTPNNLFVLDLDRHDPEKDGVENFNKLINTYDSLPFDISILELDTLKQSTPSGGIHIIYKSDNELKNVSNGSNVFKDYPGIDIRTDGYIVIEPSTINNVEYSFYNIKHCDIADMPEFLKQYVLENVSLKNDTKKQPYEKPKAVEVGDRDNQLFSYINNLYYKTHLDYDEIMCLANYFNENVLEKPLPERTVKYKVNKVFDKDRNKFIFINLGEE